VTLIRNLSRVWNGSHRAEFTIGVFAFCRSIRIRCRHGAYSMLAISYCFHPRRAKGHQDAARAFRARGRARFWSSWNAQESIPHPHTPLSFAWANWRFCSRVERQQIPDVSNAILRSVSKVLQHLEIFPFETHSQASDPEPPRVDRT
jgi:hypothetical protein